MEGTTVRVATSVATPRRGAWLQQFQARVSHLPTAQKLFLVQQLSIMTRTGISLAVALKTLSEQTASRTLRRVLNDLRSQVERGNPLHKALERHRAIFGELFISMVAGGEASGKFEEVLNQLYLQLKRDHALVAKVRGAMLYPMVIIVAMLVVGILTMVYMIPNLITIFEEVEVPLPLATRVLIGSSKFAARYGVWVALGVVAGGVGLVSFTRRPPGRLLWHWLLLRLPVVSVISRKINIARFCRTFSSLLKTDIAIIRSFEITSQVLGNVLYRRLLEEAKEKVKRGLTIRQALASDRQLFPPVVLQMIGVGEETGALDNVLEESAAFYESDVDQTMTTLPTLIEPILIVVLGLGVAGLAMAVIMPLYSISQQI